MMTKMTGDCKKKYMKNRVMPKYKPSLLQSNFKGSKDVYCSAHVFMAELARSLSKYIPSV